MDKENKKPSMKKEKRKNSFRNPISFRFSGFKPTENGSFGPAKEELKAAYPLIQNVSFLGAEKRLKKATQLGQFFESQGLLNDFFSDAEKPITRDQTRKNGRNT